MIFDINVSTKTFIDLGTVKLVIEIWLEKLIPTVHLLIHLTQKCFRNTFSNFKEAVYSSKYY